jgi:hypothetical protein
MTVFSQDRIKPQNGRDGSWADPFPLTQALSLGERENSRQSVGESKRVRTAEDGLRRSLSSGERIPRDEISRLESLNPDLRQSAATGPCSAMRAGVRLSSLRSSRLCVESARPRSLGLSCVPPGQGRLRLGFGVAVNKTQRREKRRVSSSGDLLRQGLEITERFLRFMETTNFRQPVGESKRARTTRDGLRHSLSQGRGPG